MVQQNSTIADSLATKDKPVIFQGGSENQNRDFTLIQVLTRFAYRKWQIAKITGIFCGLGLILVFVLPVRYTSTTKLMPPQQAPSAAALMTNQLSAAANASSLSALAGIGVGVKNPNDIYIGMLNSRVVADAIIDKFDLMKVYRSRDRTAARKDLALYTEITSEKSSFIAVSVTDKNKQRAADIANEYTNQMRIITRDLAMTEAAQRRMFFEAQLNQTKDDLVGAEVAFQKVQQSKGLVQLDAQARVVIQQIAVLRGQVAAKEVELESLRSYSTDQNPQVQLAEQGLASLKEQVTRLEGRGRSGIASDLGLEDVPNAGMEYVRAERELIYRRTLYEMLLKQYDAAKLDEARNATIIQVVEPAIPSDRRSSPKRILLVVLITVCGLAFACVMVLAGWWKELSDAEPERSIQWQEFKNAVLSKTAPARQSTSMRS